MLASLLLVALAACGPSEQHHATEESTTETVVMDSSLFYHAFPSDSVSDQPILVLVLHGDAPFRPPSYQYGMAKRIAIENTDVVTVGVLRPGYVDGEGNRSPGVKGKATGDNYTQEVVDAIWQLAQTLQQRYQARKVLLVGHSGGAAISANLLASYPEDFAGAFLISCPCDVPRWREHMKDFTGEETLWSEPITSLSPMERVGEMNPAAQIHLIHGGDDRVVPAAIAADYASALRDKVEQVSYLLLQTLDHDLFMADAVYKVISRELLNQAATGGSNE